jgi:competence protein ComEC
MKGDAGLRIAGLALAMLAGTAAQLQQPALWPPAVYASMAAVGAVSVAAGWRWQRAWLAAALGLAALAFALAGLRAQARLADALAPELEGRNLVVVGVVAQLPRRLPDGVRFTFEVEQATHDGRPVRLPSRLSLGWYGGWQEEPVLLLAPYEGLAAGQRWRFAVRLKQPHGSLNPHGFDYELWMFEQGLRATGYVRATDRRGAERLGMASGAHVERARQALRDAIEARVADARAAGVLAALAVGDQAAIERGDWDLFRATGTAHLVAISGLHVTMFAWLAAALIGRLWRLSPRAMLAVPASTAARWGGLVCAAAYALLAGWGVPAQRTVWMLAAAALLAQLGLRWPWPLVLAVVAALVIAIDPWALLSAGFWLSFVAVGLLLVAEPGARELSSGGRLAALAQSMRHGLRTQVVATLGLAPLTLVFFQQLSVVGFVANLVAIPVVTLLVTPLALAGVLLPPLWQLSALLVQGLTQALAALVALPGAVWSAPVAPWWAQAAALGGAALLVAPLPWRQRALALPLMLPLLWPAVERPAEGAMQVTVADVGQGSAILVRTRTHALLHDTGAAWSRDADAGTRVLVPLLRAVGVAQLDVLMLSHRDSDHVGGAAAVLSSMPVAELSSSLEATHPLLAAAPVHRRCEAGQTWSWDGVRFAVLHPRAEDYERIEPKPNTLSCVLSVTDARGQRLLLTGDLEAEQEARLARDQPADLRADILLVPHHGSRTSSSPAFLDAVAPRVALVQAGYRNRFGHPAAEVAARYAERGIELVGTVDCGAWTADSGGAAACERQQRRRYWHHGSEVAGTAAKESRSSWPSTSR